MENFAEKYPMSKVNVVSEARKVDDFYPRAQLHKLLKRCGKPELAHEKVVSNDFKFNFNFILLSIILYTI